MKRIKVRKISSISGVITNSSTEVFEMDLTNNLIDMLIDEGIYDDILIITNKNDLVKLFKDTEKSIEERSKHYFDKFQNFIECISRDGKTDPLVYCSTRKLLLEYKFNPNIEQFINEDDVYNLLNDKDTVFTGYGEFGESWKKLRKAGKSIEEIVDLFEPILSEIYFKAIYSNDTDNGFNNVSEILRKNGYYPSY